jgi:EAL domain-containing protein (putative c-di-GMP-specific phosphodiesterase class I)
MWEAVLADMRHWLDKGEPVHRVAVNMSPVQVGRAGLAERLLATIDRYAIPGALIEIEITETALMGARAEHIVRELTVLRGSGISVALDDFGTGYSSLSHLARFPVDVIKIDRSFVSGLMVSRADEAVVEAILGLSKALGLTTVAEGVETVEQAARLRDWSCPIAQGFLFSEALPSVSFDWRTVYHSSSAR